MLKAVRLNSTTYPVEEAERAELARAGAELIEIEGQEPHEILAAAEDCDALLVVSSRVPGSVIERLSRCRVIARLGAGTDKIYVAEATRRGIVVTNVPDFCLNEQAEHTLALLLAHRRRTRRAEAHDRLLHPVRARLDYHDPGEGLEAGADRRAQDLGRPSRGPRVPAGAPLARGSDGAAPQRAGVSRAAEPAWR